MNGTRERLRAVLMTAVLAALGLLPAALSDAIGSETQRPIEVVVVAGTLTSAVVTVLVLPLAYTALRRIVRIKQSDLAVVAVLLSVCYR